MLNHPYIDALYIGSNKRDDDQFLDRNLDSLSSIVIGLTVFLVLKLDSFRQVFQIMLLFICLSMMSSVIAPSHSSSLISGQIILSYADN